MNKKIWILILLPCLIGVGAWFFLSSETEEDRIRSQLIHFERVTQIDPEDKVWTIKSKTDELKALLHPEVKIEFQGLGSPQVIIIGSEEAAEKTLLARRFFKSLSVEFQDVEVKISSQSEASVSLTGLFTALDLRDQNIQEVGEFEIQFLKTEKEWRMASVRSVSAVEFR